MYKVYSTKVLLNKTSPELILNLRPRVLATAPLQPQNPEEIEVWG